MLVIDLKTSHDIVGTLVSDDHFLQETDLDVNHVVEPKVIVPLIGLFAHPPIHADPSNVLCEKLSVLKERVLFCDIGIWGSEAEEAVRDAVLVFNLLRADLALESYDSRNHDSSRAECMLILVQSEKEVGVEIENAAVE